MENDYYVYILECADGSYYTGVTSNLEKRMAEHDLGIDTECYTFSRRPLILRFSERFGEVLSAIEREKQIKGWSRKKKEALMLHDFEKLQKHSVRRKKKA